MSYTPSPLTYQIGNYTGDDWLIAIIEFGTQYDGTDVRGYITTDHVHASELVLGEPEADLRLWTAAPELLEACEMALEDLEPHYWTDLYGYAVQETVDALRAAITKVKGK